MSKPADRKFPPGRACALVAVAALAVTSGCTSARDFKERLTTATGKLIAVARPHWVVCACAGTTGSENAISVKSEQISQRIVEKGSGKRIAALNSGSGTRYCNSD